MIMKRFREIEFAKEKFYAAKNIAISKLDKTKTNSKYLIGYSDKAYNYKNH